VAYPDPVFAEDVGLVVVSVAEVVVTEIKYAAESGVTGVFV
jgi:hypothetical protein